jgi:hypothetical protein
MSNQLINESLKSVGVKTFLLQAPLAGMARNAA